MESRPVGEEGEGETPPPPLGISRRLRTGKRWGGRESRQGAEGVRARSETKTKKRSGSVSVIELLSWSAQRKHSGLQMAQAPLKQRSLALARSLSLALTHIRSNFKKKKKMDGEEGGLLGACRVRLNPLRASWEKHQRTSVVEEGVLLIIGHLSRRHIIS